MPNFENSKIYRIDGNGLTYIGSTTESLQKRLKRHRDYIKEGRYCSSSKVLSDVNHKISLIEEFPCKNNFELTEKEYYWFSNIVNCNDISPHQQKINVYEKYVKNNPEVVKARLEATQKWRKNNKEKIKEAQQNWRENNKEKIKEYNQKKKERRANGYYDKE
jgi:hypothetical protein